MLAELAVACERLAEAAEQLIDRIDVTVFDLPGCEKLGEDKLVQ